MDTSQTGKPGFTNFVDASIMLCCYVRTFIEDVLEQGKQVVVTFVDYSAAFDSVSHKFIDLALADAGESAKSRAIFRTIYRAASATTRVADVDGTSMFNPSRFQFAGASSRGT